MPTKYIVGFIVTSVIGFAYHEYKISKTLSLLDRLADATMEWMESSYQRDVDDAFENIVENLDE